MYLAGLPIFFYNKQRKKVDSYIVQNNFGCQLYDFPVRLPLNRAHLVALQSLNVKIYMLFNIAIIMYSIKQSLLCGANSSKSTFFVFINSAINDATYSIL